MNIERLRKLYAAGEVKRLHTVVTLRTQTIAEHVYGSLLIARELCEEYRLPAEERWLISLTLLLHDAPEIATGDIPAPVKWAHPKVNEVVEEMEGKFYAEWNISLPPLSNIGSTIVKVSDAVDLALTCIREIELGNRTKVFPSVQDVFWKIHESMEKYDLPIYGPTFGQLRQELVKLFWEAMNGNI